MAAVRMTLLKMVQNVMSELSMDNVNHIQDSSEAQQVAHIIEDAFYDSITTRHWPHLRQMLVLRDTDNPTLRPTHLAIEDAVQETYRVQYNTRLDGFAETDDNWEVIEYLLPEKFLDKVRTYKTSWDNVQIATLHSGVRIPVKNDTKPTAWTSFDDEWLVFDAWDSNLDTTIHTQKCWAHGVVMPEFNLADDFVMDMPLDGQREILADAKVRASLSLLKVPNTKMEQVYKRNERFLSRKAWRVAGGIQYPDYGRKARRGSPKSAYIDKNPYREK